MQISENHGERNKFILSILRSGMELAGGGAVTNMVEWAWGYRQRLSQQRMDAYCRYLLENGNSIDAADIENIDVPEADFHALLTACAGEIEDEKVTFYAHMTLAIATKNFSHKERRHLILSLRDLTYSDLEVLRKMYVASINSLVPPSGGIGSRSSLLSEYIESGAFGEVTSNALSLKGMVQSDKLSSLGKSLVVCCYKKDELTPKAMNWQKWSTDRLEILFNGIANHPECTSFIYNLTDEMYKNGVRTNNLRIDERTSKISRSTAILIPFSNTLNSGDSFFELIERYKRRKKVFILLLPDADEGVKSLITYDYCMRMESIGQKSAAKELVSKLRNHLSYT